MGNATISLLAFIAAISILVAVHEFGHYIVGRWSGMKVLRFSIGFGKPLWTYVAGKDETEYCISTIPLGGYVRFLDSREGPVDPADEGRAFDHRPIPARIAVLLAGPAFNFLFAVLAYWVLFGGGVMALKPAVGDVTPDSYADRAGLQYGDKIVAVGDVEAKDWESTLVAILDNMVADGRVPLTLEDEGGRQRSAVIDVGDDRARLTEPGLLFDGLGFEIGQPPVEIGALSDGGAAESAGLRVGDRIVSVDGQRTKTFNDLVSVVATRANQRVAIEYTRNDVTATIDVVLGEQNVGGEKRGLLGISLPQTTSDYYYRRTFTPLQSLHEAATKTWTSTIFTVHMLGRMVTGDVSIKNISGPINIGQIAGESAQRGAGYFLGFLAIVSISLGVLNLLPIPILDGGQIVYQVIEMIKGSPMTDRAQILGQQVGIFALLLLMSFAFYNDIARILG
ncbi:MAG: RIP metalloprotease RseP [Gammaproteobacteria bacterium]|nr:RIP metalloprotease RseP [Gammaproteobacteria bacterium]MBT8109955.1 RIP metalloprotease RseP [Gammaproteobacteria bacterium]NND47585.1 RIP metalloprotease RseP [Woeseiaceae bacterium]NNL44657.1 RIP metalloprotease RseP [Woeseiaceae bacterium]